MSVSIYNFFLFQTFDIPFYLHILQAAAIAYGRQTLIVFDPTWLELGENIIMEVVGQKITPLSINPGRIVLSTKHVYFQPFNNNEIVSRV